MSERVTMTKLAEMVPDEAAAYAYMERLRWNGVPTCPHCHDTEVTYLNPDNGTSRKTRTGAMSARRVWQCRGCRKQFSVLTGTVMHGTRVSIRIWLFVIFEMAANKNGVAEAEVARRYGLCNRTAWHLLHRIREAMGNDGLAAMMGGNGAIVVADEAFFGGSMKNKSNAERKAIRERNGGRVGPQEGKVAVLSLIDTASGVVRSRVVPDVAGPSLAKALAEQVDMAGSVLYTDQAGGYRTVGKQFLAHEVVNHSEDEYVRYVKGKVITTNAIEGFFSQLKRSVDGTHHHVSSKHLNRYLGEFDFRYSTRKVSDTERMGMIVDRMDGLRLTYRPMVAA